MIMHKAFQELFETVQADEELKNRTKVFLNQKRQEINSNKTKKSFDFPFYGFLKIGWISVCMGFILWECIGFSFFLWLRFVLKWIPPLN